VTGVAFLLYWTYTRGEAMTTIKSEIIIGKNKHLRNVRFKALMTMTMKIIEEYCLLGYNTM
jgi:hypothetical protein